jgi:LysR family transcriptional activator of nhaA
VTWDLLAPAAAAGAALFVREGAHDHLVSLLDARALDLVLTESPVAPTAELRCTRLREEPVAWFAADPLAEALTGNFPRAMDGAPVLLPAPGTELRRAADDWLASTGLQPRVLGEFADTSLAKVACADGLGAMLLPRSASARVAGRYGLREVGVCAGLTQRAYAVTTARRASLPAVEAVLRGAAPERLEGIT